MYASINQGSRAVFLALATAKHQKVDSSPMDFPNNKL